MRLLSEYNSNEKPRIGNIGVYDNCGGASSLMPYDTSKASGLLEYEFSAFSNAFDNEKNSASDLLDQLETEWGAKFIKFNGKSLGFVNKAKFMEIFNRISDRLNSLESNCKELCTSVSTFTDDVIVGLNKLLENHNSYLETKELANIIRADGGDPSELETTIHEYEVHKTDFIDIDGQWVIRR